MTSAKPGKVRRLSVISKLHGNVLRQDPSQATWVFGLLWFGEDIGIETVRSLACEKLLTIPRFRSSMRMKFGRERFVELKTEDINLDYHIAHVTDAKSQDEVYDQYISNVYANFNFDISQPLWRFVYFTNVQGRSMLLVMVHHAIGDGVSIIEVLYKLMDKEDQHTKGAHPVVHVADPEPLEELENEEEDAEEDEPKQITEKLASLENAPEETVRPPTKRRKPKNGFGPLNKLKIFVGGVITPFLNTFGSADTPSPLMRKDYMSPSVVKSTAFTEQIPLEKIKEVKNRYPGATINDILVSLLTMTLRGYLEEVVESGGKNGQDVEGAKRLLRGEGKTRSSFPINARKPGSDPFRDGSPCNKIALGELSFHFDYANPTSLVWKTKRTLDRIKLSPTPFIQQRMANTLIRILPKKKAIDLFQKVGAQSSTMLSNVAGPQHTVHIRGHKVEDLTFALYGGQGLYIGLLSYNSNVSACICLDHSLGSAEEIAKHWKPQFDRLYEDTIACGEVVPRPSNCSSCFDKL